MLFYFRHSFNNGNWLAVEIGLKKFIQKRNVDANVFTGTHDIMIYPDINNQTRKIYLATNNTKNPQLPVPKFYYKVVIVESINAGIAFIGVNNPYATEENIKSDYILCPDVSDKVNYINWQRTNITAGYSYACEVSEFAKHIKYLPKLPKVKKLFL